MKYLVALTVLLVLSNWADGRNVNPMSYHQYYQRNIRSQVENLPQPTYLLITTSSKIYSLEIPANFDYAKIQGEKLRTDAKVIYAENDLANNWITDAFYVKSEDLIYVNVYNSSASASDIFTLKYNRLSDSFEKNVLYRNQRYCLGKFFTLKRYQGT